MLSRMAGPLAIVVLGFVLIGVLASRSPSTLGSSLCLTGTPPADRFAAIQICGDSDNRLRCSQMPSASLSSWDIARCDRGAGAVEDSFGDNEAAMRAEFNGPLFQVHEERAFCNVEEI